MVSRSFSYPFPVVGWSNDVEGEVKQYELSSVLHDDTLVLTINGLEVTNATVAALINAGLLGWCVRLYCRTTYFRQSWLVDGPSAVLKIPLREVAQTLEVAVEVVARQPIDRYAPQGLHEDFGSTHFRVSRGDVIAVGADSELFIDLGFDPLKGEVSSIMRVDQSPTRESGPFEVNFDAARITILLPKLDWDPYKKVKHGCSASVHAGLVLPVLVEAIALVRDPDRGANYAEHLWFQRIRAWLDSRGLDDRLPLEAAQTLLQQPFTRMLGDVAKLVAPEEPQ